MDFDYFYGRGADQFAFYQIPKILITDEKFAGITMESKILYSLMLDRASFSVKNGWLDEDGKVFICYKLDRIMADMHCANQKATKMLKELEDKAGLIERQKQGQSKPTKIYVKDFATGLHDYGPDRRIIQTHENHESRNVIITGPDSWKSCTNNTNYKNTDFINTNPINLSAESASPKIKVVQAQEKEDSMRLREQYEDYLREKLEIEARTNYAKDISNLIRDTYCNKINVFKTEIPRSVRAAETSAEGKSIFAYDLSGKVAEAYSSLTQEVLNYDQKRN